MHYLVKFIILTCHEAPFIYYLSMESTDLQCIYYVVYIQEIKLAREYPHLVLTESQLACWPD